MRLQSLPGIVCIFFILAQGAGCAKEYSFEGAPGRDSTLLPDSTIISDTTPASPVTIPTCAGCNGTDTSSSYKWSFKIGSSFFCGEVTRAVLSHDSTGMTFFGPSACSVDSGLIITAFFLNPVLTKDQANITADRAALEYYDNTTQTDVLQSKPPNIFSLTIDSYRQQSGLITGKFSGSVVDKSGRVIKVDEGKFRIKF